MELIKFEDFSAFYKLKKEYAVALDKVSFSVHEGEFLVIVGPSGCGKTTLLKCLLGMCSLTDGNLLFEGEDIEKMKIREKNFACVSQEYSLYPQMTVYENIAFPLRMAHVPHKEVDARVNEIAKQLEIDWLLSRKPKQLSGGQHQRVAIARALVKNPRVVLFDEPFSNMDPELRLQLRKMVKQIHSEQRPTILFVTHDLTEALMLGERILVMNRGEVMEIGTPEEIEENPQSEFTRRFFGK